MNKIIISGFSDEICINFEQQLKAVRRIGMNYISLRAANGKGIADFTLNEAEAELLPLLNEHGVKVSSLGSPIGKIKCGDEEAYKKQLLQLEELCKMCKLFGCRYIRMFSFYIPENENAQDYKAEVIAKLSEFVKIAERYGVILIHENEKGIYGDIAARCREIFDAIKSPSFKAAFDYANFVQCGEDTEKCWELLKNEVVYIHIKDATYDSHENVLCGTGNGKIEMLLGKALSGGYEGFLTLEPHLFLFDSLKNLETVDSTEVIKENKASSGEEAYKMQYEALTAILNKINK